MTTCELTAAVIAAAPPGADRAVLVYFSASGDELSHSRIPVVLEPLPFCGDRVDEVGAE